MLKVTQFCKFLKLFEAGDFLNIFLRFWSVFEEEKRTVVLEIPYCEENEKSKYLVKSFYNMQVIILDY